MQAHGNRIYAADSAEAFFMFQYKKADKQIQLFAENTAPRHVSASCIVDSDTIAGGDKFGNIVINRLPENPVEQIEESTNEFNVGVLQPAPNKVLCVGCYRGLVLCAFSHNTSATL